MGIFYSLTSPRAGVMERSRYWAMVLLIPATLLVVALYFTSNVERGLWTLTAKAESSRVVMGLLKRQELGLIHLWNASLDSRQADVILSQIRLNRNIQQILSGRSDDEMPVVCHRGSSQRKLDRLVKWKPRPDRYLLAICTSGQISNHLICLEKHMFFSALLNRTLVLPSSAVDYDYEKTLDIAHIRSCLGNDTILSFQELIGRGKTEIRMFCYMHGCYLDEEHEKKLRSMGLSWSAKNDAWPEEASVKGYPSHPHASEFISKFTCDDEVLAIGDVFYADVESKWVAQLGGPLLHPCKTILRPNRLIVLTAQRFVQTFLGKDFLSLHFRRHGFLKFCNVKEESCFFPIPQAAECILSKLQWVKPQVIYLSTDAAESEINLLQALLVRDGYSIPIVRRPEHDSREKWDALLQRKGLLAENEVIAMLDKTICAMAKSFIGTPGSTFTDDIMRLRREWGSGNSCDGYLCEGEHPDFIADTE